MSAIARPFGQLLMFLYGIVGNYGLSLILFAIVVRVILLPFQMKSKRGMMRQSRLQPKIADLQKRHGTNKAKINEEMAKLYKEEGVNPASGCLWGFLPLPIMLALFLAIRQPLTMMMGIPVELIEEGGSIYNLLRSLGFESVMQPFYAQVDQTRFISEHFNLFAALHENLRRIDFNFLGLDLGRQPQWTFLWNPNTELYGGSWFSGFALFLLPLFSAGSQFLATAVNKKINPAGSPEAAGGQMKTFMMLMPLMSVYFGFIVPAALSLYWTIGTLLQIVQDVILTRHYTKIMDAEDAIKNEERMKKEEELEAKRVETERKKAEGTVERNPNTSKRKKQKSDKQEQLEKTAEWEKKNAPPGANEPKYEPSREGNRRYARGRAYDPDRFSGSSGFGILSSKSEDDIEDENAQADEEFEGAGAGSKPVTRDGDGDNYEGADENDDGEDGDYDEDDDSDEGDDADDSEDDDGEDDDSDEDDDDSEDNDSDDDGDSTDTSPTVRFDTARFDEKDAD